MACIHYDQCKSNDRQCVGCDEREAESSIPSADLLADAAQCLDDCLIRIYPDEFTEAQIKSATHRWSLGGGTIARIAKLATALRANASPRGEATADTVRDVVVRGGE